MDVKQLLGAITGMIIKVALSVVIIIAIFRIAIAAYDFGFQVFADIPVSEGEGRPVSVVVSSTQDVKDIAKMLEEKGLIRDDLVFVIQEKLSESDHGIESGTYELNTAMTSEQILAVLTNSVEATEVEE